MLILSQIMQNVYADVVSDANAENKTDKSTVALVAGLLKSSFIGSHQNSVDEGKQYIGRDVDPAALFSVLGGYTLATNSAWLPFYTFSTGYHPYGARVKSAILQYGLPQQDAYDYQYKLQQKTLSAHMKANVYRYHNVMPFVSLSMGLQSTQYHRYQEDVARATTAHADSFMPNFNDKTINQLSYVVGAGIDYMLRDNLWIGFEYGRGDFSDMRMGSGRGLFSADYLKNTSTASTLALNIHYFLDKQ